MAGDALRMRPPLAARTSRHPGSPGRGVVKPEAAPALGPGQPLDPGTRTFFEPRFSHDLGGVRIHDGDRAARAARSVSAQAFTVGERIVFDRGRYAPGSRSGRELLAHELAHVVQQRRGLAPDTPSVLRSACSHDGRAVRCGAGAGRWILSDIGTDEVQNVALDDLIVNQGMAPRFPGRWATQVQTPPNPVKAGRDRGFADGMKVRTGGSLSVEVVEIKSRASGEFGGCGLASTEAEGYVGVLEAIAPQVTELSQRLATAGGLQTAGGRLGAADRLLLSQAGIDLDDPDMQLAWRFYNSLQNRLGLKFTTPFSSFDADVNRDGTTGTTYTAGPPVGVECRTRRGRPGIKSRQLGFQVNEAGGVSYGCEDGPCEDRDEEQQRRPQTRTETESVDQPVGRPGDEPEAEQPSGEERAPEEQEDAPEQERPIRTPIILAGGAAAAGLSAAAIAAARRRARRIAGERAVRAAQERAARAAAEAAARRAAARNVINLAERRAAREAARRAGTRLASAPVAKAVVAAEVAAAVFLISTGRAEAKVGLGPSPLEALYESMRQNGAPPSPEMRELLESDPVLRQLAEEAMATGDPTPLQEAAARQVLEILRDHADEFTQEDLEILAQMSGTAGSGAGITPETAEELRAAIDQARTGQSGGEADGEIEGGQGTGAARPGPGSEEALDEVEGAYPGLSPEVQGALASAPEPVRRLFDAMTGSGDGPRVDDAVVRRFLQVVPVDLSPDESTRLIGTLRPVEGEDADAILGRLEEAVQSIREGRSGEQESPEGTEEPGQAGEAEEAVSTDAAEEVDEGLGSSEASEGGVEQDRVVALLRAAIEGYDGWDSIGSGQGLFVGRLTQPVGTETGIYSYVKGSSTEGETVRVAAYLEVRITTRPGRPGQPWRARVLSSTPYVSEHGQVLSGLRSGTTISGRLVE